MPKATTQSSFEKRRLRLLRHIEQVPRFKRARQTKALIDALQQNDENLALWLLEQGCDPNAADYKGRTALWWAAMVSLPSIIRELVRRGAALPHDVLMGPVDRGDEKTVRLLIRHGANVNCVASRYSPVPQQNIKQVLLTVAIGGAWRNGEAIPLLLVHAGAKVNRLILPTPIPGSWNFSMLGLAAFYGLLRTVREMIAAGAKVNFRDGRGRTALFDALEQGHFAVVKELLGAGARTDIRASDGLTPLEALRQQEQPLKLQIKTKHMLGRAEADNAGVRAQVKAWHRLRARMLSFLERHNKRHEVH